MAFDLNKEIAAFFKKNPFLLTEHNLSFEEYFQHFRNKYDCIHTFRSPFLVDPTSFANDHRDKIVQTYSNTIATPSGHAVITTTVLQFSTTQHVTLAYLENEGKLAGVVQIFLKIPKEALDFLDLCEKYKIVEREKKAGFGSHFN